MERDPFVTPPPQPQVSNGQGQRLRSRRTLGRKFSVALDRPIPCVGALAWLTPTEKGTGVNGTVEF